MKKYSFYGTVFILLALSSCGDHDLPPNGNGSEDGFRVRMDAVRSELIQTDDARYPISYMPIISIDNIPPDVDVLGYGGCYSYLNREPDLSDYNNFFMDESLAESFRVWSSDQRLSEVVADQISSYLPGRTYYYRVRFDTNKGVYYSNTVKFHTGGVPVKDDPEAYEIPVVFHLFPFDDGSYLKEYLLTDMIEFANMGYSNYRGLPHLVDTKIRFSLATHAPDGTPLQSPGIVYESGQAYVDDLWLVPLGDFDPTDTMWDPEFALNVWVCQAVIPETWEPGTIVGYTTYPLFHPDDMLEGMFEYDPREECFGVVLNSNKLTVNNMATFAHEAAHSLGLLHPFEEDWCDDTYYYDIDKYDSDCERYFFAREYPDAPGTYFLADNIMDYPMTYNAGFTPDQSRRMQHSLRYAYFMPGQAGKVYTGSRSDRRYDSRSPIVE